VALLFAVGSVRPAAAAGSAPTETHFHVTRGGEQLGVMLLEPAGGRLAADPLLLLNFATDRATSLHDPLYGDPVRRLLAAGHRAASFDVPAHGERIDAAGKGIDGLRERLLAGRDPFAGFVDDGRAVIDECIRRGLAKPGRIVVCGNSRSGYGALRLAAADSRISAVAALAPVTDWRELREFAAVREVPAVAALALENYAVSLAGRPVYMALGNADQRVGTAAYARLVQRLAGIEADRGLATSRLCLLIVDDSPGHTLADRWSAEAARFLIAHGGSAAAGQSVPINP
jgi:dienelactone hydrolase